MKLRDILTEAKISSKDRRELTSAITGERTGTMRLSDGSTVDIEKQRGNLVLNFHKDNDELIFTLTSIADTLGLDFDYQIKNGEMHFKIEV